MEEQIEGSNKKVMVIIDESEYSYHAFMWVLDHLRGFITDSPLVIFAALPTPNCNFAYGAQLGTAALYCPVSPNLIGAMQETSKKVLLGILEKAVNICASRGVKAEIIAEAGEPYELISSAVQKNKINLLVFINEFFLDLCKSHEWYVRTPFKMRYCINMNMPSREIMTYN
ncbi:unnamed protein product [Dovyalis caffra]|uniref:UspA domain-containing protein n=1 Tax=Dovyalis caffra TaxID=77055 RepID=A0AAV1R0R8_9ROSI|nr:unnamed protein product [Dovyalis caffra]